jgi:hypothetical protein
LILALKNENGKKVNENVKGGRRVETVVANYFPRSYPHYHNNCHDVDFRRDFRDEIGLFLLMSFAKAFFFGRREKCKKINGVITASKI